MTNGDIECGPSAVFTFKREGYKKTDFSLKDTAEALGYSGTWKLFFKNMKFGIDEQRRAFSKKLFLKTQLGLLINHVLMQIANNFVICKQLRHTSLARAL